MTMARSLDYDEWYEATLDLFEHLRDTLSEDELAECFALLPMVMTFDIVNGVLERNG